MISHSPASSPELPELPKLPAAREFYGHDYVGDKIHAGMGFIDEDMEAYATAHGRACYEAGSAAAAQAAWRPIAEAPKDGTPIRVIADGALRPMPGTAHWWDGSWRAGYTFDWEDNEHADECLGYYPTATRWMPLPAAPTGDQA